tara:strand:- start:25 stop:441 length:417 start_codon:yes stop_codon:yes gene_type:complete
MSKLWEDLKDNMKEWSNSAVEKAEEMSRVAMAKTEEMTRISKIKFENHQIQRKISSKLEKLGSIVHNQIKKDNNSTFAGNKEFFAIITEIDELNKNVKEKEQEIQNIKKEFGINENDLNPDEISHDGSFLSQTEKEEN